MSRLHTEYRESGVEWLGDVPEHWLVKRLRFVASINDEALTHGEDPLRPVSYVDIGSVDASRGIIQTEEMVFEDAPSRARRLVRDGDTIVSTVRTYLRAIAAVHSPSPDLVVSTGFAVIRPFGLDPGFCSWALREKGLVDEVVARSVGVSYPAINASQFGELPVPLPPQDEQCSIAKFLDRETERIDALVEKKRLLIERLEEYRTALITRTVTRGLPPEAARAAGLDTSPRLKATGVEWLGDVPEHWEVGNIRRFATMKSGHTPSRQRPEYWDDCHIPWFTLADVWQLRDPRTAYAGATKERVSELGIANSAAELLPTGTVMLSRTASIGFSGIMPEPMATSQDYWNWVCSPRLLPEYLLLVFRSMRPEYDRLMMGSTHRTIYEADAASLHIPVPPLAEQRAIATCLHGGTEHIEALRGRAKTAIERLQEYCAALITAAVTGSIDVRGAAQAPVAATSA